MGKPPAGRYLGYALSVPWLRLTPLAQDDLLALLPRLRRYARVLTADTLRADELLLDTLRYASGTRIPPAPRPLRHWPFAVMHRLHGERSAPELRRPAPPLDTDGHAALTGEFPPLASVSDRAVADEILVRLWRLPVEQREVLVLVVLEGLPYAEIAALLGVQIGTVMSRLRCAREGMRSVTAEFVAPGPPHDSR